MLLPTTVATKHHGLLGKATTSRRFLRQFAHTLGANAVFVAFVLAARQVTQRGGDEALEEWRSAAACTRGRFRPDGYGCYRRAAARFGFFLEFDRGTERPAEHAAKLASYYRYRDSGAYTRDYASFPTLLVVTTTEVAEARFALQLHLAQQRYGGAPLPAFLTTIDRIQDHSGKCSGAYLARSSTGRRRSSRAGVLAAWSSMACGGGDGSRRAAAFRTITPILVWSSPNS